jgi:microcystin-dependent protein
MSEPFLGEIRMFAGNFAPQGWALCDGQLLAVAQNDGLFSLLGTIYGGDGRTTFGLPEMRGRIPIHAGTGPGLSPRSIGSKFGEENVTVIANTLPSHTHTMQANTQSGPQGDAAGSTPSQSTVGVYLQSPNPASIAPLRNASISQVGNNQQHNNVMPYLCINFIIALFGVYPSRN